MAIKMTKPISAQEHAFAPEADDVFGVVDESQIAKMRKQLNTEYGIGQGRLVSLDDTQQKG